MSSSTGKILVALIVATTGVVIVMTVVRARTIRHQDFQTQSTATPAPVRSASSVEVVTVTVLPTGFEPREIKREHGLFLLAVDNRSNLRQLNLHLVDQSGTVRHRRQFKGGKLDSRELLDLPTGRYFLREVNQKDWVCSIEIN